VWRFFAPHRSQVWDGEHAHPLDEAGLMALAFSRSYMPAPDAPDRACATEVLRALFARHAVGGEVTVRYRTVCHLATGWGRADV
jgi:hypothetical protein